MLNNALRILFGTPGRHSRAGRHDGAALTLFGSGQFEIALASRGPLALTCPPSKERAMETENRIQWSNACSTWFKATCRDCRAGVRHSSKGYSEAGYALAGGLAELLVA